MVKFMVTLLIPHVLQMSRVTELLLNTSNKFCSSQPLIGALYIPDNCIVWRSSAVLLALTQGVTSKGQPKLLP